MKSLISLVLVLSASSALAGNGCNLQFDAGLRVAPDSLQFFDRDKAAYSINDGRYLIVNGKALNLTTKQQALVQQYDRQVRALVPEVRGMALEGIDLAITGVTEVFDGLLGERNKISTQLNEELTHLKGDVRRYFDEEVISIGHQDDDASPLFAAHFETRVERIVETSVQDSIGAILISVGKEILSSGGNMEAFEARMERFGREMELQMQAQAAQLEARGAGLCRAASALNTLEDQLRDMVPDIHALDLIRLNAAGSVSAAEKI